MLCFLIRPEIDLWTEICHEAFRVRKNGQEWNGIIMLTHKLLWKNSNEVDWINNKNNNCKDEKRDSLDPQEGQAIGIVTLRSRPQFLS